LKLTRIQVEKYKNEDRDENRHTFLELAEEKRVSTECAWTSSMKINAATSSGNDRERVTGDFASRLPQRPGKVAFRAYPRDVYLPETFQPPALAWRKSHTRALNT